MFLLLPPLLVDYYAVGMGIIHSVVSASALALFIKYIFYRYLQFLNHIIIKTKLLLPQV